MHTKMSKSEQTKHVLHFTNLELFICSQCNFKKNKTDLS